MKLEINLDDSLSRSALFEGIHGAAITKLSALSKLVKFKKGETIIREADLGTDFFWISSGKVEIQMGAGTSTSVTLKVLDKGNVVGELALFGVNPRSATALAVEDSELYRWSVPDCLALFKSDPAIGCQLLANLGAMVSKRMVSLNQELRSRTQFDIKVLQNLG